MHIIMTKEEFDDLEAKANAAEHRIENYKKDIEDRDRVIAEYKKAFEEIDHLDLGWRKRQSEELDAQIARQKETLAEYSRAIQKLRTEVKELRAQKCAPKK